MALINRAGQEISAKVVYYGPGLSGKTTNLELLFKQVPEDHRGKMISMKTRTDRTLFFDLLPFNADPILDHQVRILLYTVPGQVYYNATRRLVLKGVDAIVFVADSQRNKLPENLESLENLRANLADMGLRLEDLPWVIQYNKRDLHDILSIAELEQALNPSGVPNFTAVAPRGEGVHSTLRGVIQHLEPSLRDLVKRELGTTQGGGDGLPQVSISDEISSSPSLDPPRPAPSRQSPATTDLEPILPEPILPEPLTLPVPRVEHPPEGQTATPQDPLSLSSPDTGPGVPEPPVSPPLKLTDLSTPKSSVSQSPQLTDPPAEAGPGPMDALSQPPMGGRTEAPVAPPESSSPHADDSKEKVLTPDGDTGQPSVNSAKLEAPLSPRRGKFDLDPLNLDDLPDPLVVELPIRGRTEKSERRSGEKRLSTAGNPAGSGESPAGSGVQQPKRGDAARGEEAKVIPAAGGELIIQVPRQLLESGELRLRLVIGPERPQKGKPEAELLTAD